jgi:small subunit ribosomal protein S1
MTVTTADFAKLFEESTHQKPAKPGDLVKGTVVKVLRDYIVVDIGFKSEGQIPIEGSGFGRPVGTIKPEYRRRCV